VRAAVVLLFTVDDWDGNQAFTADLRNGKPANWQHKGREPSGRLRGTQVGKREKKGLSCDRIGAFGVF
jgi:hypothetical protein